jgi:hypothetical protein
MIGARVKVAVSVLVAGWAGIANAEPLRAIDVFHDTCVVGEAKFARGVLVPAARADLPNSVRRAISVSGSETIYRLSGDRPAFLIVQDGKAADRTCIVVAPSIRFSDAVSTMTGRRVTPNARIILDGETKYDAVNPDGSQVLGRVLRPDYVLMARTTTRH